MLWDSFALVTFFVEDRLSHTVDVFAARMFSLLQGNVLTHFFPACFTTLFSSLLSDECFFLSVGCFPFLFFCLFLFREGLQLLAGSFSPLLLELVLIILRYWMGIRLFLWVFHGYVLLPRATSSRSRLLLQTRRQSWHHRRESHTAGVGMFLV